MHQHCLFLVCLHFYDIAHSLGHHILVPIIPKLSRSLVWGWEYDEEGDADEDIIAVILVLVFHRRKEMKGIGRRKEMKETGITRYLHCFCFCFVFCLEGKGDDGDGDG